jgi:hypothetical protein
MQLAEQPHRLMKVANGSGLCVRFPYQKYFEGRDQKYFEEEGWSHRSRLVAQVRWLIARLQYPPQNQLLV